METQAKMIHRSLRKFGRLPFAGSVYRSMYRWTQAKFAHRDFAREYAAFKRLTTENNNPRFQLRWEDRLPCLGDKTAATEFDRHYVYHLAWAARVLAQAPPPLHIDISSSLHFCTMLSAFMPVKFYDYRPAELELSDLTSEAADLHALPFKDKTIHSLSCMHVVEHVGLGRYGDPLDANGDLKAIAELSRVLAAGGSLLFVVPVGKPKIMFNAHRVYSYEQIVSCFADLELKEFALIPENSRDGGLITSAPSEMVNTQSFGCGCFWFKRNA